jgi:hypothetical protein
MNGNVIPEQNYTYTYLNQSLGSVSGSTYFATSMPMAGALQNHIVADKLASVIIFNWRPKWTSETKC